MIDIHTHSPWFGREVPTGMREGTGRALWNPSGTRHYSYRRPGRLFRHLDADDCDYPAASSAPPLSGTVRLL